MTCPGSSTDGDACSAGNAPHSTADPVALAHDHRVLIAAMRTPLAPDVVVQALSPEKTVATLYEDLAAIGYPTAAA